MCLKEHSVTKYVYCRCLPRSKLFYLLKPQLKTGPSSRVKRQTMTDLDLVAIFSFLLIIDETGTKVSLNHNPFVAAQSPNFAKRQCLKRGHEVSNRKRSQTGELGAGTPWSYPGRNGATIREAGTAMGETRRKGGYHGRNEEIWGLLWEKRRYYRRNELKLKMAAHQSCSYSYNVSSCTLRKLISERSFIAHGQDIQFD